MFLPERNFKRDENRFPKILHGLKFSDYTGVTVEGAAASGGGGRRVTFSRINLPLRLQ